MKNKPLLIIGGGGHAAALAEILIRQKKKIVGVVAPQITAGHIIFENIEHFFNDDDILKFSPKDILLVNGIGSMPYKSFRETVYNRFRKLGYEFVTVIADSALVSDYSILESGVQIMNNSVVNIGSRIGENSLINTSVSIDHDCNIGENCHLAPGTTLSGQVIIEKNVHVATGVNIINNITIGHSTIVGVGANITKSIPSNSVVYGARSVIKGLGITDDS
ncbi:NeuD/PglB/VioB family sugar acetyltransferase [Pseudoalteromonas sp. SR45-1]|uniref:NeuD/PglB/VioB family sugar acetyltransferase n=1 Tax=unclassified Pseudoalteromonas TaxID=194690 RepID=UPI0015F794F1|nr:MULTISPECIES: NeuD/PglB/VioB family sugar acetyltransferase [unclassified Pseudoalteromonas]MBB1304096.1 NeuD/PglB/VioB family sugar acetyltransferase [Pseudoalteromonas sp. SR43-5]MBB1325795.1 NeuD/PglB/VioB family sugar acetyltransferase [Pseudoalteromonas sp. SR45-1]